MLISLVGLIVACTPVLPQQPADTPVPLAPTTIPSSPPTSTASILAVSTQTASPTPTAEVEICSPLMGILLADIPAAVSNPYHPPKFGRDDPHAGVDLADRDPGSQIALEGREVLASLAGRVVMKLVDRFPFGNAVLIETPLDDLPGWLASANVIPTTAPTPAVIPALSCPTLADSPAAASGGRSLYLLYAHLQSPSFLESGDAVACGQPLGQVGATGNALNPHLHLEARVGLSGIVIPGMAHYDNSATMEEMAYYCLWSVSGTFQLVDPLRLIGIGTSGGT